MVITNTHTIINTNKTTSIRTITITAMIITMIMITAMVMA